ncbi:MAG: TonB-dependent receptor [Epsilonproteobacteria bacterium]|nr:TonB-dependent receptor [Campylobacterota bacterium]
MARSTGLMVRLLFSASLAGKALMAGGLLDYDLEDLSQIVTETSTVSNRYALGIDQAVGSVTVVTDEEIARHGYKTLQELLNTVVGFDEGYHIYRSLVSSRGFRQDINSNYLLLVDGHRINENAYGGFDVAHIFPLMSNIARVEIIRGPSSTLWGSDAINGIIAITTKSAVDFEGSNRPSGTARASVDYEFENERIIVDGEYAKRFDNTDLLLSAHYFDSDTPWTRVYGYGVPEMVPYKKPQSEYDYMPSYKVYAKISHGDLTLLANRTHYVDVPNDVTYILKKPTKDEKAVADQTWFDLIYSPQLTDTWSLESRIFYDNKVRKEQSYLLSGAVYDKPKYIDEGAGGEAILHHTTPTHHFLAGLYGHRKRLHAFNRSLNFGVTDKNFALFGEFSYEGIASWIVTVGGRAEYGSPRGDSHSFLPRASLYWQANEDYFLKYSFNTGSLRPTLLTTRDYYYTVNDKTYYAKGADKSQRSYSHDFQIGYRGNRLNWTATLFYSRIDDLILWGDQYEVGTIDGVPVKLWETNLADITQKGIELEWRYTVDKSLAFYGNYAYADTRYAHEWVEYGGEPVYSLVDDLYTDDSLVMAGAPQQTWNVGVDWDIRENISLNFHYRGRYGVLSIYPNPEWETFGAEHFFDTNLRWLRPFGDRTELDFYVKNIGDNQGLFPMGYGKVESQLGRQIGLKLSIGL